MKPLAGKSRKWYEHPLPPDLEDKAKFVDMMLIQKGDLDYSSKLGQRVSYDMRYDLLFLENPFFMLLKLYSMINPNPGHQGHFYHLAASALDF
ncbi:UPF0481 protein isoform X3 [Gossypium australe]|uniref:UPF0481 protein isoform X3 n=1 Tax=Gossypium australe TaxID=47621 RepID=A0A5B6WWM1_9ROSI|nr:UPF0481 protein isoform X3 [Gossypium australe]